MLLKVIKEEIDKVNFITSFAANIKGTCEDAQKFLKVNSILLVSTLDPVIKLKNDVFAMRIIYGEFEKLFNKVKLLDEKFQIKTKTQTLSSKPLLFQSDFAFCSSIIKFMMSKLMEFHKMLSSKESEINFSKKIIEDCLQRISRYDQGLLWKYLSILKEKLEIDSHLTKLVEDYEQLLDSRLRYHSFEKLQLNENFKNYISTHQSNKEIFYVNYNRFKSEIDDLNSIFKIIISKNNDLSNISIKLYKEWISNFSKSLNNFIIEGSKNSLPSENERFYTTNKSENIELTKELIDNFENFRNVISPLVENQFDTGILHGIHKISNFLDRIFKVQIGEQVLKGFNLRKDNIYFLCTDLLKLELRSIQNQSNTFQLDILAVLKCYATISFNLEKDFVNDFPKKDNKLEQDLDNNFKSSKINIEYFKLNDIENSKWSFIAKFQLEQGQLVGTDNRIHFFIQEKNKELLEIPIDEIEKIEIFESMEGRKMMIQTKFCEFIFILLSFSSENERNFDKYIQIITSKNAFVDSNQKKISKNNEISHAYLERCEIIKILLPKGCPYQLVGYQYTYEIKYSILINFLFNQVPFSYNGKTMSSFWKFYQNSQGVFETYLTDWNPFFPKNPSSYEDLSLINTKISRIHTGSKPLNHSVPMIPKAIQFKEIQELYFINSKECILELISEIQTDIPFKDLFKFKNCFYCCQDGNKTKIQLRYEVEFSKFNLLKSQFLQKLAEEIQNAGKIINTLLIEILEKKLIGTDISDENSEDMSSNGEKKLCDNENTNKEHEKENFGKISFENHDAKHKEPDEMNKKKIFFIFFGIIISALIYNLCK